MRTLLNILILLIVLFGGYLYFIGREYAATKTLCASLSPGAPLTEPRTLAQAHGLRLMGPHEDKARPGVLKLVFCSNMTLCDVGCSVEYQNGQVLHASWHEW